LLIADAKIPDLKNGLKRAFRQKRSSQRRTRAAIRAPTHTDNLVTQTTTVGRADQTPDLAGEALAAQSQPNHDLSREISK
jgi:hypothetical protein